MTVQSPARHEPDTTATSRDVPQHLTVLTVDRRHRAAAELRDVCALHSRIGDACVGMPDGGPRILWATPTPDTVVVRAPEPVTSTRWPAPYVRAVSSRLWCPPRRPGRYRMVAVVNPGRHTTVERPTLNQPDRKARNGPVRLRDDPADMAAWLGRRLTAGGPAATQATDPAATVVDFRVTRTWVARGRHREGRTITVRCVAVAATVDVHDPSRVAVSVVGGVGIDKTWGCGLTVWEPAP